MIRFFYGACLVLLASALVGRAELFIPEGLEEGDLFHVIFVTDEGQQGLRDDLTIRDDFVNEQASVNPDLEGLEFKALLTTGRENARDRVDVEGPVYRLDGTLVAEDERDLWNRSIEAPVNVTPSGETVDTLVWTGSGATGRQTRCRTAGTNDTIACQFGSPDLDGQQYVGTTTATDSDWFSFEEKAWTDTYPFYALSGPIEVPEIPIEHDFNDNGMLDAGDIDILGAAIREGTFDLKFDLDQSFTVDIDDLKFFVTETIGTYIGDSNLDLEFNSSDLVATFVVGQYEDSVPDNSTWATGDWNQDQEFTSSDLVFAFADGGFEQGPREATSAVPEPSTVTLFLISLVFLKGFCPKRHS